MTNRAGHSHRGAHCSLRPDGPRNKSAPAEAASSTGSWGGAGLLVCRDIAQAQPRIAAIQVSAVGAGTGAGVRAHSGTCGCVNTALTAPDRRVHGFVL